MYDQILKSQWLENFSAPSYEHMLHKAQSIYQSSYYTITIANHQTEFIFNGITLQFIISLLETNS